MTSGAEDWILNGHPGHEPSMSKRAHQRNESTSSNATTDSNATDKAESGRADEHSIDLDHSWKSKLPPFEVRVHSPQKHTSSVGGAYTVYSVTSIFDGVDEVIDMSSSANEPADIYIWRHSRGTSDFIMSQASTSATSPAPSSTNVTVQRRFSQFVFLHTTLTRAFPGLALPPLPAKQYAGRFNDAFVEARRGELQRYLKKIVRHPVIRYAEVVTFFLGCESDAVSICSIIVLRCWIYITGVGVETSNAAVYVIVVTHISVVPRGRVLLSCVSPVFQHRHR